MAAVKLHNVCKTFNKGKGKSEVNAVKNLSLECRDSEFISLLGPSGCGKTSTLRMIAGLEEITSGQIRIGDRLVNNLHPSERDIAMVFESYALYEHLTVFENMAFPLRVRRLPKTEIDRRIARAVDVLDISDLLSRMPAQLSDGQKQRVSIGRAIVREPAVFLMDEPISHLDAMLRNRLRREIQHLQKELGVTTIYVTHDQLEATVMADRIVVMNVGELQQVGSPREIFESPANVFVANFVGEPPMNLFEAELVGSARGIELRTEDMTLSVQELALVRLLRAAQQPRVILGIRPMHVKVSATHVEGAVRCQVFFVERLDEYNIVTAQLGHQRILIETEPSFRPQIDEFLWLSFPEPKLHFFHPVTQKRIN